MKLVALALVPIFVGCASYLEVHDSQGGQLDGVPVRVPLLAEVKTKTTYDIDSTITDSHPQYARIQQACGEVTKTDIRFLPLGEQIFVSFKPARFGKSEFKVEFADGGTLKSVSLNSDPAASVESTSSLLGAVLPFLSAPKAADPETQAVDFGDESLENLRKQFCIQKSSDIVSITPRALD